MKLVIAQGLTKIYRRGQEEIFALRNVNLEILAGSFNFIVGPSGGGKSTLLHLLGGMDQPTSGQLTVKGISLESASEAQLTRFRREHVGFVFQFYNLLPSISALENVSLPLLAQGKKLREAHAQAAEILDTMGLSSRKQHRPTELSGGEQQRVAIARAVIGRPSLILADEPTGDLDTANAEAVIQLMSNLNRTLAITFVIATHNESLTGLGDKIFELRNGEIRGR